MMRHLATISTAIKRRWSHRQYFVRLRDWGITLYDAMLRYFAAVPLPLRGASWPVRLRGVTGPAYLRLGTSDGAVLEEVFLRNVYGAVTRFDFGRVERIVDLGANVGLSVKLWLEKFPDARVIAVEPDPENLEACRRNIVAADVADRVSLVNACVAATPGVVYLRPSRDACAYQMTRDPGLVGPMAVAAMTIPQIVAIWEDPGLTGACADTPIDLMKVDIEGAEQELFGDCASWIGRVQALMIELHPPYSEAMLLRDLATANSQLQLIESRIVSGNPLLFLRSDSFTRGTA